MALHGRSHGCVLNGIKKKKNRTPEKGLYQAQTSWGKGTKEHAGKGVCPDCKAEI